MNRQGGDTGTREPLHFPVSLSYSALVYARRTEYRSAIFFHTPEQESIARRVTEEVQKKHFDPVGKKIVTDIVAAGTWWDAEDYHQEYLFKNPSGYQCPTHKLHW